jgi:hypothetical protein
VEGQQLIDNAVDAAANNQLIDNCFGVQVVVGLVGVGLEQICPPPRLSLVNSEL